MSEANRPGKAWLKRIVNKGFALRGVGLRAEEQARLILAEAMADKRRRVKKIAKGTGTDAKHNVAVSRFANDRARSLKKEIVRNRTSHKLDQSVLMRRRAPSPILDALDPARLTDWRPIVARRYKSTYPRLKLNDFDFLNNPVSTIQALQALSKMDREEVNAYIDFDDDECRDIGAFLVIAEFWHQLSPIFRGGRMSLAIQKVLNAVSLRRELGMGLLADPNRDDIWPFEIRRRRTRGTTTSPMAQLHPQDREQLNDALIKLMDQWLFVASEHTPQMPDNEVWELTGEGKANIANMIGEILDNAERHSVIGGDGDWSMAAFMVKVGDSEGAGSMKCHMAFLSVGRSISETITDAPSRMKAYCDQYAQLHANCGRSWGTLVTIAALQDGVTCSQDAEANGRGGTGLQDTLGFVGDLAGAPDPGADVRVTIVSGKSCIRLRHPILVGSRDGKNRRVQWCNAANDPMYAPDSEIAFDLPAHFAGTLVSIAFTLDPALFVPHGEQDGHGDD